ncbi:hypothetical protein GRJ2_001096400 [Grus japonensis]|uniref:Uncharacterized protein n=1 Tax=Grus japonensis TaxID=30415 RepID=A0ABC9WLG6_GRUJA
MRICERNNSADTKVSAEGVGGGVPGAGAEIPLQPLEKTMVRQAVSMQSMEDDDGAEIPPAAHGVPHAGAGGCPKEAVAHGKPTLEQAPGRTCGPMERGAHTRAGLLAGLVTPWGTHAGAVCS